MDSLTAPLPPHSSDLVQEGRDGDPGLLPPDVLSLPLLSRDEERTLTGRLADLRRQHHRAVAGLPVTAETLVDRIRAGSLRVLDGTWRGAPPPQEEREALVRSLRARLRRRPSPRARSRGDSEAWDRFEQRLSGSLMAQGLHGDFFDQVAEDLLGRAAAVRAARSRSAQRRLRDEVGMPLRRLKQRVAELDRLRDDRFELRNELARRNVRLVIHCAKRFQGQGVALRDLVQEGTVGLLRGIELFEPERGFKLSTYVVWWIRQSLVRAVQAQARTVRLPAHVNDRLQTLARAERHLGVRTGAAPSDEEVARSVGEETARVRSLRELRRPLASLDAQIGPSQSLSLHDVLADDAAAPEDQAEEHERSAIADRLLASLEPEDRHLLQRRFGLGDARKAPATLSELSSEFGLSRESLRKRELQALERLRRTARKELGPLEPGAHF